MVSSRNEKTRLGGGSIGLTVWSGERLWTATEDFELDRDAREQRQHHAGGDHSDGGLHRGAAHQPDAVEQGSQIPDIERSLFTIEADFVEKVGLKAAAGADSSFL